MLANRLSATLGRALRGESTIPLSLLFISYLAVDIPLTKWLRTANIDYDQSSLTLAFFQKTGWIGLLILVFIVLYCWSVGLTKTKWQDLEQGKHLFWFISLISLAITWFIVTLEFNYYYEQLYTYDRILILVFFICMLTRPIFVLPWLVVSFVFLWQLGSPGLNNGSHFAHKLQVMHILSLFTAWICLQKIRYAPKTRDFLFLVACLIASAYWAPAFKKLSIDWLYQGELFMMLFNAHAHGWLSFMDLGDHSNLIGWVKKLDLPMRLFVLTIEAGCLFIAWRRKTTVLLLALLSLFHLGVFALFGYFFWTWIGLNILFITLLIATGKSPSVNFFTPFYLCVGILLIYTGKHWCFPSSLGWIDGRISYTYRYQAIGESNEVYDVPFSYFEPYGDVFTMANFAYLNPQHGFLANPYGSTSRQAADAVINKSSLAEVVELENTIGWNRYDKEKAAIFYDFLQRFMEQRSASENRYVQQVFSPPRQFWTHPRGNVYDNQEPIKTIVLTEVTTLFSGNAGKEIRETELKRIKLRDNWNRMEEE